MNVFISTYSQNQSFFQKYLNTETNKESFPLSKELIKYLARDLYEQGLYYYSKFSQPSRPGLQPWQEVDGSLHIYILKWIFTT